MFVLFLFLFSFVFIFVLFFFSFCLLFMRRLLLCVIQFKSVSNDLRINWIPSSLVNFLDMINIMYFLSRVLGFHPKFACCGVPPKICICVYTDTIRFFLYGYHPFLLIRIPSVSFYTDTIRFFVITGFHPFLNRFNSLLLVI